MKRRNKIFLIFFICLILISCNKNNTHVQENANKKNDSLDFNKYVVQDVIDKWEFPNNLYNIEIEYQNICSYMVFDVYRYIKISGYGKVIHKHLFYYSENLKKWITIIEYPLYSDIIRCNVILKIITNNTAKKEAKGIMIRWVNKLENLSDFKYGETNPKYSWKIDKSTDTIYTNINKELIKKIYPEFKGVIVNDSIKKIVIDYQYSPENEEFYKNIKFIK